MLKIEKLIYTLVILFFAVNLFAQTTEPEPVMEEEPIFDIPSTINDDQPFTPPTVIPKKVRRSKRQGRYGFYGSGVVVIPFIYDELPSTFSDFMIAKKGLKKGVINKKNEVVIPFIYDNLVTLYDNYKEKIKSNFIKAKSGKLHGIISRQGEITIPVKYPTLSRWRSDVYLVGPVGGKYGLLSTSGKTIHPFTFENESSIGFENQHIIKLNGKYGICDDYGKSLVPAKYEQLSRTAYNSYLRAKLNGKRGLLDKTGKKEMLPFKYDNIIEKKDKTWLVIQNEKKGILDANFNEMLPMIFDEIKMRNDHYFLVEQKNNLGIVDLKGKEVLPIEYRGLQLTEGHIFIGLKKGAEAFFVIDKTGTPIIDQGFRKSYRLGNTNFYKIKNNEGKYALLNLDLKKIVTDFEFDNIFSKRKKGGRLSEREIQYRKGSNNGVLSPTGEKSGLNNNKNTSSYKSNQKVNNKKATIKKNLVGTWEGLIKIGIEEYWHELSFEKGGERGERRIYFKDKGKDCFLMQQFFIVIIGGGYQPYQVVVKTNAQPISSCGVMSENLSNNIHKFQQEWLNTKKGQLEPLMIKEVTKKRDTGKVDFSKMEKKIRLAKISNDLKSKLISKPGGDSNAQFAIDPNTLELSIVTFGRSNPMGKIQLEDKGYVLSTTHWETTGHYALSGTLKNIKFIDSKGKVKTGDLDLCFRATSKQHYWLKEFKE